MKLIFNIIHIALLYVLFYAAKWSIDPTTWSNFWAYMAGDNLILWDKHVAPYMSHTMFITLVLLAIFTSWMVRIAFPRKQES